MHLFPPFHSLCGYLGLYLILSFDLLFWKPPNQSSFPVIVASNHFISGCLQRTHHSIMWLTILASSLTAQLSHQNLFVLPSLHYFRLLPWSRIPFLLIKILKYSNLFTMPKSQFKFYLLQETFIERDYRCVSPLYTSNFHCKF